MSHPLTDRVRLSSTSAIPWLTFGLYNIADGSAVEEAVETALGLGYRSFDNATLYGNEQGVGRALARSGVAREELFLTSKVWNGEQGYQGTRDAVFRCLDRLQVDYLDLYLLHWPVPGKFTDSWRALEELHEDGTLKAIGVSNFTIKNLDTLLDQSHIAPAVNQVELHPHFGQFELADYLDAQGIRLAAWSPLKHGKVLRDPLLLDLATKHGKSPAQIVLRWLFQRGVLAVVKAATPEHIRRNSEIGDFELSETELQSIHSLDQGDRIGPDPALVDYSNDDEFIRIFQGWEAPGVAIA